MATAESNFVRKLGGMNTFYLESTTEAARYILTTPPRTDNGINGMRSSEEGDSYFTGTSSLAKALQLMVEGYTEPMRLIKQELAAAESEFEVLDSKLRLERRYNVHGAVVSVPRHLALRPDSMIELKRHTVKEKMITLVFNISISANTPHAVFLRAGINIMKLVMWLEHLGYRVRVYAGKVSRYSGTGDAAMLVKLKDYSEPLDPARLCFTLIHPSALRRVMFAILERCPLLSRCEHGYGTSVDQCWGESKKQEFRKELMKDNVWYASVEALGNTEDFEDIKKWLIKVGYAKEGMI